MIITQMPSQLGFSRPRRTRRGKERELRKAFGKAATFTHVGKFTLVHLDRPSAETVAKRLAEFDPRDLVDDDCPMCQMILESGGQVVYDDRPWDLEGDEFFDELEEEEVGSRK